MSIDRLAQGKKLVLVMALGCLLSSVATAQNGRVIGQLTGPDGEGVRGVKVMTATGEKVVTGPDGRFDVSVPPGASELLFESRQKSDSLEIQMDYLQVKRLKHVLDWDRPEREPLTVAADQGSTYTAWSPVAASTIVEADRRALEHDAPVALSSLNGTHAAQTSALGYDVSSRGHGGNSADDLAVRIDGRDTSLTFSGGQDWSSIAFAPGDVASADLLRGAGSSLYVGDAPAGLFSVVTSAPSRSGGGVRVGGGEESSQQASVRWNQAFTNNWAFKVLGDYRSTDAFRDSRVGTTEYGVLCGTASTGCIPGEAVGLTSDSGETVSGSARLDFLGPRGLGLALEGGGGSQDGTIMMSDLGRVEVLQADTTWFRLHAQPALRWEVSGSFLGRDAPEQTVLAQGNNLVTDDERFRFELRHHRNLGDKLDLTLGLSHTDDTVATAEIIDLDFRQPRSLLRRGRSAKDSALLRAINEERDAIYGSLDWRAGDNIHVNFGVRWDDGSYFEPEFSPRASVVFGVGDTGTLRVSAGRTYRFPTYQQLFLQYDIAPAFQLASLEPICALDGTTCGFDIDPLFSAELADSDTSPDTRQLFVGNENLEPETTDTIEVGFRTELNDRVTLDLSAYQSSRKDVISGPLQQVGAFGRINPSYQQYQVPTTISPGRTDQINGMLPGLLGDLFPFLTEQVDRTPFLARYTYGNLGDLDLLGADIGVDFQLSRSAGLRFNYSYLDADADGGAIFPERLTANAPEGEAGLTFSWNGSSLNGNAVVRWVDDFTFASGPYVGQVDSYTTLDLMVAIPLGSRFEISAALANALDEDYFATFGGNLLGRRGVLNLGVNW